MRSGTKMWKGLLPTRHFITDQRPDDIFSTFSRSFFCRRLVSDTMIGISYHWRRTGDASSNTFFEQLLRKRMGEPDTCHLFDIIGGGRTLGWTISFELAVFFSPCAQCRSKCPSDQVVILYRLAHTLATLPVIYICIKFVVVDGKHKVCYSQSVWVKMSGAELFLNSLDGQRTIIKVPTRLCHLLSPIWSYSYHLLNAFFPPLER